jgi:hypothetical protein
MVGVKLVKTTKKATMKNCFVREKIEKLFDEKRRLFGVAFRRRDEKLIGFDGRL